MGWNAIRANEHSLLSSVAIVPATVPGYMILIDGNSGEAKSTLLLQAHTRGMG